MHREEAMGVLTGREVAATEPKLGASPLAGGGRGWRWANAVSLAIHLAVVLVIANVTAVPAGLGDAVMVELVTFAPPPEPAAEPPPEQPKEVPPEPQPKPATPVKAAPKPKATVSATPSEAVKPAATPVMTDVAASAPAPSTEPASTPAVAVPPVVARGIGMEDYSALVWGRVMRFRPPTVRASGTTVVKFSIDAAGTLVDAEVATSSGNGSLDRIALDSVRRASPFPPPPKAAVAEQLRFTIPFQFR